MNASHTGPVSFKVTILKSLQIFSARQFYTTIVAALFTISFNNLSAQSNRFEAGISAKARGQYLTAIRSWQPLAEDGMPEAQVNLGHMYNEGLGVNVDFEEALYWYTLASESDQPEAVFNLGLLYLDGNGVTQNAPTALDYFERAEELGVAAASYMLGTLQLSGEQGVPVNLERGRERIRQAALGGVSDAQFTFANVLLSGVGAPRKARGILDYFFSEPVSVGDPFLSYVWGRIAQENGNLAPDLERLVGVTEVMLEGRRSEAEELITECIASGLENCPSRARTD